jgi:carnitine-CoA ligase
VPERPTELFRGTGHAFGPYYLSHPLEERTMLHVLADRAAGRGDHPWLIFDSTEVLTYRSAWELANRVADAVRTDVRPGAHVGLFQRNQVEFFPTFYGAMLAGGLAVPLNADSRGPLLEDVINQADLEVIVSRADHLDRLVDLESLHQVRLVVAIGPEGVPDRIGDVAVVRWDDWLADRDATPPPRLPEWHQPCLLQFTSGTTGRAKGAIYSHHFLYLYSATVTDSLERTPDDVLTTPLPLFHVAALHLISNSALQAGCTAHLKTKFSASRFFEQAAADGATGGIILGPMGAMVLKMSEEAPPHRMEHLWMVPPMNLEEFQERYGVRVVWQGYGMTEIEPMPMRREMIPDAPIDTIGYAAQWMEWGVVDEQDRMVPPGTRGELVFRSLVPHGMCDGYYKRAEATVETFRNFMFHTGDIASYDEDGLLHFHGRKSERIRRRGENISALELEFVAVRHPDVLEAAAYGVPSPLGEEDVKLDLVLRDGVTLDDVRPWLEKNLPRYMLPRFMEQRASFPKTPSERVQKFKLAEQGVERHDVRDYEPDTAGDAR